MPLIFSETIDRGTKIGVWKITETEDFFSARSGILTGIRHPRKRLQHLAGRFLLSELLPAFPLHEILKGPAGKPLAPGSGLHFSVSHCADLAAVIVSNESDVGVDIEVPAEKVRLIQHKFLSQPEIERLDELNMNEISRLTMAWSIKEAMFKWYGRGEVDFREHLIISGIRSGDEYLQADCLFKKIKEEPVALNVYCRQVNGAFLSYVK